MPISSHRRTPRAKLDPILSTADAMAVFALQISRPLRDEVLVMILDGNCCGRTLITVSGAADSSCVVDIAETIAMSVADRADIGGLVLASVRPGGGVEQDDDEYWLDACDVVEGFGLTLFDWLVIGRRGAVSIRDELGLAPCWSRP